MSKKQYAISKQEFDALHNAIDTLRQIIKLNTACDGEEAVAALKALMKINPLVIQ